LASVCWSAKLGLFVAVGVRYFSTTPVVISRDGLNWQNVSRQNVSSDVINNNWNSVCWAADLGLFCAVTNGNDTYSPTNQRVMISRNGFNWITYGVLENEWNSICWCPELSMFCAVASSGTTNQRVMITNPDYRLPTTKSIKMLLNDGNYNINVSSAEGTFPNFRTTASGPNLISVGNGNFNTVSAKLSDSIAIGNTIITGTDPSGYGIIGIGNNVFPITSGSQNIGIGNAIATSMTTGHNNVFIGNGVATSTTSTGNTVAIGSGAGSTNITGINNTYLGAFSDVNTNVGGYNNSTALGYGATITSSNQIKLGTENERVYISGNLSAYGITASKPITVLKNVSLGSNRGYILSGNLTLNSTTESYSATTGSFQTKGGAGILGNVFINNNLYVGKDATFIGNIYGQNAVFTGDLSMNDNLLVNKDTNFVGDVSMNGNLVVGKDSTFIGHINGTNMFFEDVSMNGNLRVNKNTVFGDVSMNGNLRVNKNTVFADVSMNGNLILNKNTVLGDVSMNGNLIAGYTATTIISSTTSIDYSIYGNIWVPSTSSVVSLNQTWKGISLSSTGQYQTALINQGKQIYISSNGT
jgi:hypothetical protein